MNKNHNHLPKPPTDTSDDESVREYGRQLAMDSLIRDALQSDRAGSESSKVIPLESSSIKMKSVLWIGAAACFAGLLGLSIWELGLKKKGASSTQIAKVTLDERWEIKASADAEYSVTDSNTVSLSKGELHFSSSKPANLVVETPVATAKSNHGNFYIGYHSGIETKQTTTKPKNKMKKANKARVLVLAGMATMTAAGDSVQAAENEAVVVNADGTPEKIALKANSQFAMDLYKQLANEAKGGNVFFSPYSINSALMMAAEGARGETAEEMGLVLGFPSELRRNSEDSQRIPWEMSKMHTGMSSLDRLFSRDAKDPKQIALIKEVEQLKEELEETRKEKLKAIKSGENAFPEMAIARVDRSKEVKQLIEKINKLQGKVNTLELNMANAFWGEVTHSFKKSYTDTINNTFKTSSLKMADFVGNHEVERENINTWAEGITNNKIKNLIPEGGIDELTRLVLVNAIYFKADWAKPFKASDTKKADFALVGGGSTQVSLMNKRDLTGASYAAFSADGSYFETPQWAKEKQVNYPAKDGFSIVELPYAGDEVSMVIIAPNKADGLATIESNLNSDNLSEWIGHLKDRKVHVNLPKFKSENTYDKMKDTLTSMGIKRAFTDPREPQGADFGGISTSQNPNEMLYINGIVHKSFIEVNEKGTEAAAATAVMMAVPTSIPREKFIPEFNADRPFIYLIRDNKTGSILFLGRMMNPAE